jgi:hypothetical protein
LAIAAGASFVAPGFSSEPQHLAEIMVEALRWPGFSYVEVLSPCIVFRPEEFEWKVRVRLQGEPVIGNRAAAFAAATADSGYNTGVLFKACRPAPKERNVQPLTIAAMESELWYLWEIEMADRLRVVLTSFQGSRAFVELHYGDRHARLELDQLEDRYVGQSTEERATEELSAIAKALTSWLSTSGHRIESA